MNSETENWGLVVSFRGLFDSEDAERAFVHGVEFGMIHERMMGGREAEIDVTIHSRNREVVERAAAAGGWDVELQATDFEEWTRVILRKVKAATPNPVGLRVVRDVN